MKNKNNANEIKIFQVGCGDCIGISFTDNDKDKKKHHILIDAGYLTTYPFSVKPFVEEVLASGQKIDLFVITHYDNDHIGGMHPFIHQYGKGNIVEKYWFNYSHLKDPLIENPIGGDSSFKQGKDLRDNLLELDKGKSKAERKLNINPITTGSPPVKIGDAKLTVLSPGKDEFEKYIKKWKKEARTLLEKKTLFDSSYKEEDKDKEWNKSFNDLLYKRSSEGFKEDINIVNGSSIAFLFELKKFSILFLADARPSVIKKSLEDLVHSDSEKKRLKVDYVKLSHHGSKRNISREMLDLIDCRNFIISSNGYKNLPNKETIALIADHYYDEDKENPVNFYFNYDEETLIRNLKPLDNEGKYNNKLFEENEKNNFNIKPQFSRKTIKIL